MLDQNLNSCLLRLATNGIAAYPPTDLEDLAAQCRDWGRATGTAIGFVLAECIELVLNSFTDGEAGVIESSLLAELDSEFARFLPGFIATGPQESPTPAVSLLKEAVIAAIRAAPEF